MPGHEPVDFPELGYRVLPRLLGDAVEFVIYRTGSDNDHLCVASFGRGGGRILWRMAGGVMAFDTTDEWDRFVALTDHLRGWAMELFGGVT